MAHRKVFSYAEACALLPDVLRLTEDAHRTLAAAGLDPLEPEQTAVAAREVLGRWAKAVEDYGLEIKGLWLVDFDNGAGYYCWRYPEERLLYWHPYTGGFAGRVPIN